MPTPAPQVRTETTSFLRGSSFSLKITLMVVVLLVAGMITTGLVSLRVAQQAIEDEIVAGGKRLTATFAESHQLNLLKGEEGVLAIRLQLKNLVSEARGAPILGAVVWDGDQREVALVGTLAVTDRVRASPPMVVKLVGSTEESVIIGAPIEFEHTILGHVFLAFDKSVIESATLRVWLQTFLLISLFGGLGVVVVVWVTRRFLRPLVSLGVAARQFTHGNYGYRLPEPLPKDEVGDASRSFNAMCDELELHVRFSNAALVDRIRHGKVDQGREHSLSITFGDAQGYTKWSQHRKPAEVFSTLESYYSVMGEILVRHFNGIIDKFMGDGIMAHFGLLKDEDLTPDGTRVIPHVLEAVTAMLYTQIALRVVSRAVVLFQKTKPLDYRFGIGTGRCLVGPIGAPEVMLDYSLLGAMVNLSSRLEGKAPPGGLVVDRFTYLDCGADNVFEFEDCGKQEVKGFELPIRMFAVRGFARAADRELMVAYLTRELFTPERLWKLLPPERPDDAVEILRDFLRRELERRPFLPTPSEPLIREG